MDSGTSNHAQPGCRRSHPSLPKLDGSWISIVKQPLQKRHEVIHDVFLRWAPYGSPGCHPGSWFHQPTGTRASDSPRALLMVSVNKASLGLQPKWSVPCEARTSRHPGSARVYGATELRPSGRVIDDEAGGCQALN